MWLVPTASPETPLALTRRARRINRDLADTYPDAHCELDFTNALELSVATILSAQCTDKRVNEVTPTLFARYRTAADYAGADRAELEELVRTTGFFRNKTNSLIGLGQALVERFDGEVPPRLADLVTLPGFGRKTANVVLGNAFGIPGITVDTHFGRLVRRWAWTTDTDPVKVEHDVWCSSPRASGRCCRTASSGMVGGCVTRASRPAGSARSPDCARRTARVPPIPSSPPRSSSPVARSRVSDTPPDWLTTLATRLSTAGPASLIPVPEDGSGRPSAVLIALGDWTRGPRPGGPADRRAADMRTHAGQVAFPGGATDPDDESPVATAVREATEEVGLDPAGVDVLATLAPLFLPPSGFLVTPVLAWWARRTRSGWSTHARSPGWRSSPWPTSPIRPIASPSRTRRGGSARDSRSRAVHLGIHRRDPGPPAARRRLVAPWDESGSARGRRHRSPARKSAGYRRRMTGAERPPASGRACCCSSRAAPAGRPPQRPRIRHLTASSVNGEQQMTIDVADNYRFDPDTITVHPGW